jgi:hypothetical protein
LWQSQRIQTKLSPINPSRVYLHLAGPQTLTIADSNNKQTIHISGGDTQGEIKTDGISVIDLSANFNSLILSGAVLNGATLITRLEIKLRHHESLGGPAVDVSLRSSSIQLPERTNRALGDFLDLVHLDISFLGPLPQAWTAREIGRWRDAGGVAEVRQARIKWGPLDTSAEGTVALDSEMRPLISGVGYFKGYPKTINAYKKAGLISPLKAAALTIALNMRHRDATGRITIPITGQHGQLLIGPWPATQLQPLLLPVQ